MLSFPLTRGMTVVGLLPSLSLTHRCPYQAPRLVVFLLVGTLLSAMFLRYCSHTPDQTFGGTDVLGDDGSAVSDL